MGDTRAIIAAMKLASYKDGSRDGQLVVVSNDLVGAHHAGGIVSRLQAALDDWGFFAPQLQDLKQTLELGKARHAFAFEPRMCLAPLPRAYRVLEAQPLQVDIAAAGGLDGTGLWSARDDVVQAGDADEVTVEAALVWVTGELDAGARVDQAREAVRLCSIGQTWRWWQQGQVVCSALALAPVVATPDALGRAWQRGRVALTLQHSLNGTVVHTWETRSLALPDVGVLLADLVKHRGVAAGTVVSQTVGRAWSVELGEGAGAEAPRVGLVALDAQRQEVFGALDQAVMSVAPMSVTG